MNTNTRKPAPWILRSVALFGAAALAGCGGGEAADETAPTEVPINVRTLTLERGSLAEYVSVSGPLRPIRGTDISTEESGVVAAIPHDKGSTVLRGESLVRLNRDLLAAEMKSAEAGRALAEHNESRMRELFEAKQISRQELLRTEAEAADAIARAETARLRWARADVKAPFDGVVAARFAELGQFVGAGTPVARVVDPYTLEVRGSVTEREAAWIRAGASAAVTMDGTDAVLEGTVHWVSVEAATNTGKFPVEVRVNNSQLAVRPGVVARAEILKVVHDNVILIPRDAILVQSDGPTAFVVEEDRAVRRHLTLGADQGLMVVVKSGLEAGERLIVRGQRRVHTDTLVQVQEEATAMDGSIPGDPDEVRASQAFTPARLRTGPGTPETGSSKSAEDAS
ncbi:MAG: MexH family multidrug efflux RND transporter periplasmic adaptor subunit [Gemmatimonadota bacterium]|nr:MAG: MexH family multidrug efflux RND transporter periplasmic adaptor subunit [Gemmatimonadota bacterium]